MKPISLLFALSFAFFAKAQVYQYVPFPDSVGYWKYFTFDQNGNKYWSSDEFFTDSIGQKKVMAAQVPYYYNNHTVTDTLVYFEDNKRIIRIIYDTLEFECFNFNLTVGDTFYDLLADVQSGYDDWAIIVSDDSISPIYGNRRTLTFDNGAVWLEGVGNVVSCSGVFDPLFTGSLGCRHFQCVFSDTASFPCADAFVLAVENYQESQIDEVVYPNPTSGEVFISNYSNLLQLKVLDLAGKVIFEKSEDINQIDLSAFPKGLYIMVLKSATRQEVVKIIKE